MSYAFDISETIGVDTLHESKLSESTEFDSSE